MHEHVYTDTVKRPYYFRFFCRT